jgi:hypothetical protein
MLESSSMRRVALTGLCLLCLSGCQHGSPDPAVSESSPAPLAALSMEMEETPTERKLNQPPQPRALDRAKPTDPFQAVPGPGHSTVRPSSVALPLRQPVAAATRSTQPLPGYPRHHSSPSPAPSGPVAVQMTPPPGAIGYRPGPNAQLPPRVYAAPNSYLPPTSNTPSNSYGPPNRHAPANSYVPPRNYSYVPPAAASPPVQLPPPAYRRVEAPPARPRLPGQTAPPPVSSPSGERRAKEKQLEQAYLQSRADALNTKYHGGRAVLGPHSAEVQFSASAPPSGYLNRPSIPGAKGDVVEAFRASEVKRKEWQSYRNQSSIPQAPIFPNPGMPPSHAMPSSYSVPPSYP